MNTQHISIGYFSSKTGLSIRALRLYDEVGLLKPALVASHNKYRYYQPEQIELAKQIKAYRENEVPLGEIKLILDNPPTAKEKLAMHLERLRSRLLQQQSMIGQVEQLLAQTR